MHIHTYIHTDTENASHEIAIMNNIRSENSIKSHLKYVAQTQSKSFCVCHAFKTPYINVYLIHGIEVYFNGICLLLVM